MMLIFAQIRVPQFLSQRLLLAIWYKLIVNAQILMNNGMISVTHQSSSPTAL